MPYLFVPHPDRGWLYPGGGHVTWGKSGPPPRSFPAVEYGSEPANAAEQRRKDRGEEKRLMREGQRLHAVDPADPWSEAAWSPCPTDCPAHPNQ